MTEEQRQKAIKLYKNKNLKVIEISNLTGIPISTLIMVWRRAFESGELVPRREKLAMQPRRPKGQGIKYVRTYEKGKFPHKSKYTPEQEIEIMQDYYEKGFSTNALREKWNIFPKQLQRLREKFRDKYGIKPNAPYVYQNKYKKREGILENGECAEQDSKRNAVRN